jgi:hypothetical protein
MNLMDHRIVKCGVVDRRGRGYLPRLFDWILPGRLKSGIGFSAQAETKPRDNDLHVLNWHLLVYRLGILQEMEG